MTWRIAPLAEHADWVEQLAAWHYAEWCALYAQAWSLAAAREELSEHATRDGWPTTWVALRDEELLGSVSLIDNDAEELRTMGSPWLASLFVRESLRGCGIGAALVRKVMHYAAEQNLPAIHLFTPAHSGFYRRLGWLPLARARVMQTSVEVMRWTPPMAVR